MKRVAFIVVAVLLLGPFATMVPAHVGEWSGLAVFMTWPDEEYEIGSQVNLTVQVFMDCEPFDPDTVNVTSGNEHLNVNMTRSDLGTYGGSFIINEDQISNGDLQWRVVVEYQGASMWDEARDSGRIFVPSRLFDITLIVPDRGDLISLPWQTIELEAVTMFRGELVDADPGSVEISPRGFPVTYIVPFIMSRVSKGHYEGSFTIDPFLTESVEISVDAVATYTVGDIEYTAYGFQPILVDFFTVWHHNVDVGPTGAEIEYYVLDLDLQPVDGAEVELTYSYDDDSSEKHSERLSAITDVDGRVSFALEYAQIGEDESFVRCDVTVEDQGLSEEILDFIAVRGRGHRMEDGLTVMPQWNGVAKADTDVTLNMRTFMNGVPYIDQEVTVYIADWHQLYLRETMTTDDEGMLSIQIHTPTITLEDRYFRDLEMIFLAEGTHSIETDSLMLVVTRFGDRLTNPDYRDPGTTLTAPPFGRGEPVEVVLECDDADGDEWAFAIWGLGPMEGWSRWNDYFREEWTVPTLYGATCSRVVELAWSDGAFRGNVVIPAFLPDDIPISMVGIISLADYPEFDIRVAILEEVQSPPPDQPPLVALSGSHTDGKRYTDKVQLSGDVIDDIGAIMVEFRIDNGSWMVSELEGTAWTLDVPTEHLEEGEHTLEVRAYDGFQYSAIASTTFAFERSDEEPGFAAMIAVMAMMTVLVTIRLRRRR